MPPKAPPRRIGGPNTTQAPPRRGLAGKAPARAPGAKASGLAVPKVVRTQASVANLLGSSPAAPKPRAKAKQAPNLAAKATGARRVVAQPQAKARSVNVAQPGQLKGEFKVSDEERALLERRKNDLLRSQNRAQQNRLEARNATWLADDGHGAGQGAGAGAARQQPSPSVSPRPAPAASAAAPSWFTKLKSKVDEAKATIAARNEERDRKHKQKEKAMAMQKKLLAQQLFS
jgi:hypothetical protein